MVPLLIQPGGSSREPLLEIIHLIGVGFALYSIFVIWPDIFAKNRPAFKVSLYGRLE